jgi:hypothetical protein
VDRDGYAVSYIQSTYWEYGSGCLLPRTGVLMQNRGVSFSLDAVVKRRFDIDIGEDKHGPDSWRTRYAELDRVPLEQWPDEAVRYAREDGVWHLRVYEDQERERRENFAGISAPEGVGDTLADEAGQVRAAFCLHLMGVYGVRVDEAAVQTLEADLTRVVEAAEAKLRESGILKGKTTKKRDTGLSEVEWSKDTKLIKARVEAALKENTPRTEPSDKFPDGQVKTDEETLRSTGDPDLLVLADVGTDSKMLNVWVPALRGIDNKGNERGFRVATGVTGWVLNPHWNVLVSSGRTSCWGPPLQQPPRKGNVRPCIIPRPGCWFVSVDYAFVELVTWAQTCLDLFGKSDLADAIRAGLDPHVDMGVEILRSERPVRTLSYTDKAGAVQTVDSDKVDYAFCNAARKAGATWAKDARQLAKAANFGLPGGLGAATFCAYAKATYQVDISEDDARKLKVTWRRKWSEADLFFNHVSQLQQDAFGQPFQVVLPRTGFVRGGCTFTSGCNTYFQGLAARVAKEAMWEVAKACYLEPEDYVGEALYGCRPVLFLHDELILEVPADRERAHEAAAALGALMEAAMRKFTPDVPVSTEPTIMARWYKEATPVWGADEVLELWSPKEVRDGK